jgi:uncharacterized membrane protein
MILREAIEVIAIVVILQICLGVILYGPLSPAPGLELYSIVVAILIMAGVAGAIAAVLVFVFKKYAGERTIKVAMLTLSEDEQKVLRAIMRAGEVRQDRLRRGLDLSKSKLSALVNNLEQKGTIIKTRYHKTNILRPAKEFGGK